MEASITSQIAIAVTHYLTILKTEKMFFLPTFPKNVLGLRKGDFCRIIDVFIFGGKFLAL